MSWGSVSFIVCIESFAHNYQVALLHIDTHLHCKFATSSSRSRRNRSTVAGISPISIWYTLCCRNAQICLHFSGNWTCKQNMILKARSTASSTDTHSMSVVGQQHISRTKYHTTASSFSQWQFSMIKTKKPSKESSTRSQFFSRIRSVALSNSLNESH